MSGEHISSQAATGSADSLVAAESGSDLAARLRNRSPRLKNHSLTVMKIQKIVATQRKIGIRSATMIATMRMGVLR
jgi:hypothetical protein